MITLRQTSRLSGSISAPISTSFTHHLSRGYVSFSRAMADEAESSSTAAAKTETSPCPATTTEMTLNNLPIKKRRGSGNRRRALAVLNAKKIAEALRGVNSDTPSTSKSNPDSPPQANLSVISNPSSDTTAEYPPSTDSNTVGNFNIIPGLITPYISTTSSAISTSTSSPTLKDLLSKKPLLRPIPSEPNYKENYQNLRESILNAFIRRQIVGFARELGLRVTGKMSKQNLVDKIIANWGWTAPLPPLRPKPVIESVIEITAPHLFLLQRDAETLNLLTKHHKLNLSAIRGAATSKNDLIGPILLKVTGRENDVSHVNTILNAKIKSKSTLRWSVEEINGFKAPRELLDFITVASDAYVELIGDEYEATSNDEKKPIHAKNLLSFCAERTITLPSKRPLIAVGPTSSTFTPTSPSPSISTILRSTPGVSATDTSSPRFLLSPFFTTASAPVPWDISAGLSLVSGKDANATGSASAGNSMGMRPGGISFRAHRLEPWLSMPAAIERVHCNENLGKAEVAVIYQPGQGKEIDEGQGQNEKWGGIKNGEDSAVDRRESQNQNGDQVKGKMLKDVFSEQMKLVGENGMKKIQGATNPNPSFILKFGHFLYPGDQLSSLDALLPPHTEQWDHAQTSEVLQSLSRPVFVPGLTPVLTHFPLRGPPRRLRRITYRLDPEPNLNPTASLTSSTNSFQPVSQRMVFTYAYPTVSPKRLRPQTKDEESVEYGDTWTATLDTMELDRLLRETNEEENRFDFKALGKLIGATPAVKPASSEVVHEGEAEEDVISQLSEETGGGEHGSSKGAGDTEALNEASNEGTENKVTSGSSEGIAAGSTLGSQKIEENDLATPDVSFEHYSFTETDVLLMERPIDFRLTSKLSQIVPFDQLPSQIAHTFSLLSSNVNLTNSTSSHLVENVDAHIDRSSNETSVSSHERIIEPPRSLQSPSENGEEYRLEIDEEIEIVEHRAMGSGVVVKTVKSVELRMGGQTSVYTELESVNGQLDMTFWEELSNASRYVPPNAGDVRSATYK